MNKKHILIISALLISFSSYCQLGISAHLSEVSFAGVNYTFKDKVMAEVRIQDDSHVEPIVTYFITNVDDVVNFYGGVGINGTERDFILPFGFNIYPLQNKSFGFQVETAVFVEKELFRGSLGVRYRF